MKLLYIKNRYLLLILTFILIISSYVNMSILQNSSFEDSNFIEGNFISLFIILIIFQIFIVGASLIFETFIIFFILRIIFGKIEELSIYFKLVTMASIVVSFINIFVALYLFNNIAEADSLLLISLSSPVNYIVKPLLICFLLYKADLLKFKILDWLIVGLIYVIILYIPNFLMLLIFS